jgi:hypothetical protein
MIEQLRGNFFAFFDIVVMALEFFGRTLVEVLHHSGCCGWILLHKVDPNLQVFVQLTVHDPVIGANRAEIVDGTVDGDAPSKG